MHVLSTAKSIEGDSYCIEGQYKMIAFCDRSNLFFSFVHIIHTYVHITNNMILQF